MMIIIKNTPEKHKPNTQNPNTLNEININKIIYKMKTKSLPKKKPVVSYR